MEGQSRSCRKLLLLQVWCGLLTVSMVVMAALLVSARTKTAEVQVSTLRPDRFSPTVSPVGAPLKSAGTPLSFIQLIKSQDGRFWEESPACLSCSLARRGDAIAFQEDGLYFLYAQVTFRKQAGAAPTKSVVLRRDASSHKSGKTLAEGMFPNATEGTVWVAKVVQLKEGDTVSLHLWDPVYNDHTYWGAYQLR